MRFWRFSFFILTMYLPGMGEPARGMIMGAGAASAKGKRARSTESCMMIVERIEVAGTEGVDGCW